MRKARFRYKMLTALCAVLAVTLIQSVVTSRAAGSPSPAAAFTDVDLSSEGRVLDAFVDDWGSFDRKVAALGKKASLTRVEFDSQQSAADDLKRRLSAVHNALREVIRKLKAAGQWDDLDARALAKTSNPQLQEFVRRDGFKKTLEEAASGLSNDANQIGSPLDALRNKIKAQAQDVIFDPSASDLGSRVVRVAYTTAPALAAKSAKCRLALLRFAVSGWIHGGKPTDASCDAGSCACAPGIGIGVCTGKPCTPTT